MLLRAAALISPLFRYAMLPFDMMRYRYNMLRACCR